MKKILVAFILIGVLFNMANAKGVKIFDLKEQYFSEAMPQEGKKHYKEAKYDLKDVIVTTDTRYNDYSYMFGLFTIDIKKPLSEWSVNIKKKNGTYFGEGTVIRLTSDIGKSYYIVYRGKQYDNTIQINDKTFKKISYGFLVNQKLLLNVLSNNGKVLFTINGKKFLKTNSKDFGNLAKIEVELNDNNNDDELYALEIYKVK